MNKALWCAGEGPAERVKNGVVLVCIYLSAGLLWGFGRAIKHMAGAEGNLAISLA